MVNRRKLIVGGGAAAVAGTLSAVAGPGLAARAAAIWGAGPASTREHAQLLLDAVNVELGLVDPDGVRRQFEQACADSLVAPPRDPRVYDMQAWIQDRLGALCGTDSVAKAIEIPEPRLLLAFTLLALSQDQDEPLPPLYPGMPVPDVLGKLEPDFLPVLVDLIREKSEGLRAFADALQATSAMMDQMVQEKVREWSQWWPASADVRQRAGRVVQAPPSQEPKPLDIVAAVVVVLIIASLWKLATHPWKK